MRLLFPLLQLRWRTTLRALRRGPVQALELITRTLLLLAFAVIGLGCGAAVTLLFHLLLAPDRAETFRTVLHTALFVCALAGMFMPLLEATANPALDARRYLRFPVSVRRLFLLQLSLGALGSGHLLYLPSLAGLFAGAYLFSGPAALPAAGLLLLFLLAVVAWSQAAQSLLQVALRIRRMREFVGAAGLTMVVVWWFFHVRTFGGSEADVDLRLAGMREGFLAFHRWLPSGWAARGLLAVRAGEGWAVAGALLLLGGLAAAGVLAAYGAFRAQLFAVGGAGRRGGAAPREARRGGAAREIPFLHPVTAAVFRKELRYIFRSAAGKYSFVMIPVFLAGIGLLVGGKLSEPVWGFRPVDVVFPGLVFYASLVTNNLVLNAFAWEGPAVQGYFLSPVSLWRVLLGKNLAFWLYSGTVTAAGVAAVLAFVLRPSAVALASSAELFVLLMLLYALCGNLTSVLQPVRRDMSNVWKNATPGVALLALMAVASAVGGLVVLAAVTLAALGLEALLPVVLLALIAAALAAYVLALGPTGALMGRRREALIAALTQKVE